MHTKNISYTSGKLQSSSGRPEGHFRKGYALVWCWLCKVWISSKSSFIKETKQKTVLKGKVDDIVISDNWNFFCGQKYPHNSLAGLNSLIPIQLAGAGDLQCFSYLITIQSEKRWNWNPEVINTKKIFCVIHSSEWHHSSEFLVFHHF